jgi:hypothetical protein
MNLEKRVVCSLCNSTNIAPIDSFNLNGVYRCLSCHSVFSSVFSTSRVDANPEKPKYPDSTNEEQEYQVAQGAGKDAHYVPVRGRPFIIEGYEEFVFFSRVAADTSRIVISEASTGMKIGDDFPCEEEARRAVKLILDKTSRVSLCKIITDNRMPAKT